MRIGRRRASVWILLLVTAVAAGPLAAPPASATFPGTVGGILFVSTRDGNREIYRMNADGSNQTRLTNHPATDGRPNASPDGTKIAFHSNRDGDFDIYTMNLDGSGVFQVTNNPGFDVLPAFSPDGTKIAFQSDRRDSRDVESKTALSQENDFDIWITSANGNNPLQVTRGPGFEGEPAWSPDGRFLLYSCGDANPDLCLTSPNGTGITRLTEDPAIDFIPDFSPDGTHVFFSSNRDNGFDVWRAPICSDEGPPPCSSPGPIDANATNVTNHERNMSEGKPSPDGTAVVSEGQEVGGTDFEVFVRILSGTDGPVQMTTEGTNHEPAWFSTPLPRLRHARSISIRFNDGTGARNNGLVVFGRLRAPGFAGCRSGQPVNVQRRVNGRWITKKTTNTNRRGRYAVEIFDQASRYRAVAPTTERMNEDGTRVDVCRRAIKERRHRHRR